VTIEQQKADLQNMLEALACCAYRANHAETLEHKEQWREAYYAWLDDINKLTAELTEMPYYSYSFTPDTES